MADTFIPTVGELIAHLSSFPPETRIAIDAFPDEEVFDPVGMPWLERVRVVDGRLIEDDNGPDQVLVLGSYSP